MSVTTAVIEELKNQANHVLAAALGTKTLESFDLGNKGNFPFYYQDTRNVDLFNKLTYDWISSNLRAGVSPLQQDASFVTKYIDVITKVQWSLSTGDLARLNDAKSNATDQSVALQNAWKEAFGSLPAGTSPVDDICAIVVTWATPTTTLYDIQNAIDLNLLLKNAPASGKQLLPVFANYINALGASVSLQNNATVNTAYLNRAKAAAQTPTEANGGLKLNDSKNTYVPAYAVTPQLSDILNSIKTGVPPVNLSMTVFRSTNDEFSISVDGRAGIRIPILSFLGIGVGGEANYFSSDIATTNNKTTVNMIFPGANLATFGPVDFNTGASSSWFWMDPIREAIKNGSRDVSGFKFSPVPGIDFSAAGSFGYLEGVAFSGYPIIQIKVTSSNWERIQKTFKQSVSSSVSFLGITLATATESTYSNHVEVNEKTQTVEITISPPPGIQSGKQNEARGWILGALPRFPAVS